MAQQASLDVKGLKCPMPMLRAKKALAQLESGDELTVYATDPGVQEDLRHFVATQGMCYCNPQPMKTTVLP